MSVRAGLRQAREVAKEDTDPGVLRNWWWPLWLLVVVVGFAAAETVALVNKGKGGTLTEWTKKQLGIDPPAPRRRWAGATFAAVFVLGMVWLVPHILTNWWWES